MEAIRPDEGPALKAGGGEQPLVSSSLTASALVNTTEVIRTGEEPAWKAVGGKYAACGFEPHGFRWKRHGVMVQQDDASIARWKSGCDSR